MTTKTTKTPCCPICQSPTRWGTEFGTNRRFAVTCDNCDESFDRQSAARAEFEGRDVQGMYEEN